MKLTLLPWQALIDGVHVEAKAATVNELRAHRALGLFEESLTDKAGRLTATQTAFSQAVSAYMAHVPDTDPAAIGRIAFASLASATPPTQPAPQLWVPDFEAQIQRHHDGQVKRDELTRLKARDECFPHFESRRHEHVAQVLGGKLTPGTVLLSDGYGAYAAYARKVGIANAQCWAHSRRGIFEAKDAEPQAAGQALEQIAALYKVEEQIRERKLNAEAKRLHRLMHSKPLVDKFFDWVDKQFEQLGLLPSNPLTKALAYVHERRAGLSVFLEDPAVAIDTNHIERALRPIPTGRKNWLFSWSEVGAKHTGIVQSLIATCRLQGIDPYTYLIDVLQRVGQHPASRVAELTPRQWTVLFADNPLRSDLHRAGS
jgi:hypothetical protein